MMDYETFISTKAVRVNPTGFDCASRRLPKQMKPFQRDVVRWALKIGRGAVFAGTGLGKSLMQLTWASEMERHTGKPSLIIAPLAVAHQTVKEAEKFSIAGVGYARSRDEVSTRIVVTNYDRVERFDVSAFGAVVLDESSIIKAHDSKTRALLIDMCRDVPYRLCCTATPAPNDYVELGNHAEFLGVLTSKEMLATWFVHDGSIRATNSSNKFSSKPVADWRLKGHAEADFWRWVSTWAVMIRHPRDVGYDEDGYDLPPLNVHQITVQVSHEPSLDTGTLFAMEANTLQERRAAAKSSIMDRVAAAAALVNDAPERPWLIWCNLNDEADALRKSIADAVEVRGSDDPDVKTDRLVGFSSGKHRVLLTKPSIAGFGLNWQHCADMIFVGLNDSFEQLYQSIRRCWRFGQTQPVNVYMIAAETEGAVVANLRSKEAAAEHMAEQLASHMKDLTARALHGSAPMKMKSHTQRMELPTWM